MALLRNVSTVQKRSPANEFRFFDFVLLSVNLRLYRVSYMVFLINGASCSRKGYLNVAGLGWDGSVCQKGKSSSGGQLMVPKKLTRELGVVEYGF